jgi:hypothetical protein
VTEREEVVIQLPLSMSVAAGVMRGIASVFPSSIVLTNHEHGRETLVIAVDPDEADPDAPYEDDEDDYEADEIKRRNQWGSWDEPDEPGDGTLEPTESDRTKETP